MRKRLYVLCFILLFVLSMLNGAGVIVVTPLVAWLALAFLLSWMFWCQRKYQAIAQYHDYLYQPLEPYDLPQRTRDYFEEHTHAFRHLGFDWLTDMRLLETPYRHDLRGFLSPDGRIMGELSLVPHISVISFTSVFDDGMKLDTTNLSRQFDILPEPQDLMLWESVPGGSVEDVYERHLQAVHDYQTKTASEVLAYEPEDYHDVITYGHRLYWHWRRRRGLTNQEVPEAVLPEPRQPLTGVSRTTLAAGR